MWKCIALIVFALTALAADNWDKVRELKPGTDVRITKINGFDPIAAKFGSLTETKLIVMVKDKEVAFDRTTIEKIDYRPDGQKPGTSAKVEGEGDSVAFTIGSGTSRESWRNVYRR